MNILDGLNPQQRQAVEHVEGPLLVVAGAGTGKTQVITRRIARLIEQGLAKPGEVLALTFTEKAAQEMADRLYELIGWKAFSVPVMTFNAFGSKLLSEYGLHVGRSTRGGLLNDTQKALLLQQRLGNFKLEYYGLQHDWYEFSTKLVDYIGCLQNAGITPVSYRAYVDKLLADSGEISPGDVAEQRDLVAIYELYEQIKQETATYDYYDQLAIPLQIMEAHPNIAARLSRQYRFVLVDEYQDTSPVQDALLRRIIAPGGNIFAVGDDDQAIYGFRGADIANILDFAEHFRVTAPVALVQNYRSGQPILDAAYRLIKHNDPERLEVKLGLDKRLFAQTDDSVVKFTPYRTASDEQTEVVETIVARLGAGQKAGSIAVLARSNATLQSYAKALRVREVPFAISTEISIFEQRELINLWYVMEWIGHRASEEAIAHIMLGPFMAWTAAHWRLVMERATQDLCDVETALRTIAAEGDEAAAKACRRLEVWRGWAADETVTRLAVRVISEATSEDHEPLTERLQRLADEGGREVRVMRVFDDLQRLLGQLDAYVEVQELAGGDKTLPGYLAQFPRPPRVEVAETMGEADGVQLLTVHASKGLEFDTVFIVNTTARAWSEKTGGGSLEVPVKLAPASELPPVHEQRRLMYVAVTRAKRELMISSPVQTAGGQRQSVSPLVAELLGFEPGVDLPEQTKPRIKEMVQKIQRFYPLQSQMPERLPFETADRWIELGVGDLDLYDRLPHDFYLEKVLHMTRPFGPQLALGSAIHKAIERFYKGRLERQTTVPLAELLQCLDEQWSDHGYETRMLAEAAHEKARETIRRFFDRETGYDRQVRSSEQPIRFEVPEAKLRLRGRIDATFEVDGGIEIRDFKTGNQRDPEKLEDKAKKSFQLRTYALALQELTGQAPSRVTLDYIVTGAEGTARLTPQILKNHRDKLVALAERLRARDFAPGTPSSFNQAAAFKYYGEDYEEDEQEAYA